MAAKTASVGLAMLEQNYESGHAWRATGPGSTASNSDNIGRTRLRNEHWAFFEANVLPEMSRLARITFPSDVAETIRNRVANGSRFRASEFLYALLADLNSASTAAGVWACASVEFLLLSRLTHDDMVDHHDYRWGLPTLQMLYGPDKASLASTELLTLAMLCCAEVDSLIGRRANPGKRSLPAAALVADHARKMVASMFDELLFNDLTISEQEYTEISARKLCSGVLCAQLCRLISKDVNDTDSDALVQAAISTDVAAAIANDVSETDQRRGLDAVRFPQGEQRGKRTEFQLGRPTIFHVFMAPEGRIQNERSNEVTVKAIDLRELSPAELFATLTELGGIDYAKRKRDSWIEKAFSSVLRHFSKAEEWIGSAARINV
jgi:geranylgeranyl pyrophosphate synthase